MVRGVTCGSHEVGGGGGSGFLEGRWPRQEALTLLEIRARLHPMFKQPAAPKAPLWDEVSRLMAEEHGYQRSGKKCKEKLDNLYKYYKKTKGLNKGRKDGRNYRFFKQLEALFGENNTNATIGQGQVNQEAIQANRNPTSSEEFSGDEDPQSDGSGSDEWNLKVRDLVEVQMRKLMEMQECWFDKMLHAMQSMDEKRANREEARREEEIARSEQQERIWAHEKAWIEARNAIITNALEKIICKCRASGEEISTSIESHDGRGHNKNERWTDDDEIANFIQLQGWVHPEIEFDDGMRMLA